MLDIAFWFFLKVPFSMIKLMSFSCKSFLISAYLLLADLTHGSFSAKTPRDSFTMVSIWS